METIKINYADHHLFTAQLPGSHPEGTYFEYFFHKGRYYLDEYHVEGDTYVYASDRYSWEDLSISFEGIKNDMEIYEKADIFYWSYQGFLFLKKHALHLVKKYEEKEKYKRAEFTSRRDYKEVLDGKCDFIFTYQELIGERCKECGKYLYLCRC